MLLIPKHIIYGSYSQGELYRVMYNGKYMGWLSAHQAYDPIEVAKGILGHDTWEMKSKVVYLPGRLIK